MKATLWSSLRSLTLILLSLTLFAALLGCTNTDSSNNSASADTAGAQVLNVYSSRHYDIDREIFLQFEEETGISVNVIEGRSHELLERLTREANNPQADVFINVDSTALYVALRQDLITAHNSTIIPTQVTEGFYGDAWTALTLRARTVLYDQQSAAGQSFHEQIRKYSDLAHPDFYDSILVRSSTNTYNIALVAGLIQNFGEDYAQNFVEGVTANMARSPEGNDRDQARAMIGTEGSLAIMSTYYVQNLLDSVDPLDVEVGERLVPIFPDETFTDITWAAVVQGSSNSENATKLIEFMIAAEQQYAIMNANGEAPAHRDVELLDALRFLYDYSPMQVNYEELGRYTIPASMMMNIAGWQ